MSVIPSSTYSRVLYPTGCLHKADAGSSHTYSTASAVRQPTSQDTNPFVMPVTPLLPLDTSYDSSLPSDVPVRYYPWIKNLRLD